MANLKSSRILAGFLAFVMVVSMLPLSMFTTVSALELDSYSVRLTDGNDVLDLDDVEVTMTNKADENIAAAVNTVNGIAVFESFVEEEATYIVTVAEVFGYDIAASYEITVAVGEVSTDVVLTTLNKINISGIVTDENGDAYEGAKVAIGGYVTFETITDAEGKYAFETYADKENTIYITAKDEDKKYNAISAKVAYSTDVMDANYQFAVKTFSIITTNDENGTVIGAETDIPYGSNRVIDVVANEGYRIEKLIVGGVEESKAAGEKSFELKLNEISQDYAISASFYRMAYKITFTVGEDGSVTYYDGDTQTVAGGSVSVEKTFNESTDPSNPTKVTVTATPAENYRVSKVTIDGNEETFTENDYIYVTSDHNTDLVMTEDHTFTVEFSRNQYSLIVKCGEHGSAIWGEEGAEITVKHGDSAKLNITPEDGYAISSITVNGEATDFSVDETGIYVNIDSVICDVLVAVEFAKTSESTLDATNLLSNEYYEISFNKDPVKEYMEGDTYVVVLPNDETIATIKPVSPYSRIKCNSTNTYSGYSDEIEINETTTIRSIYVYTSFWAADIEFVNTNIRIIIDKTAPTLDDIAEQAWNKDATVTITGTAEDEGGSGLSYIVWSKENELSPDDVLAATNNKVVVEDGKYSFASVAGEQNATYYIYAVDFAGNVSSAKTVNVKIDMTAPRITGFAFSTEENEIAAGLINFTSFGTIYNDTMYLTVYTADDSTEVAAEDSTEKAAISGIKTIALYYVDPLTSEVKMLEAIDVADEANAVTFELTEEKFPERAEIYAVATDVAGNESVGTRPKDEGLTNNQESIKSNYVQITTNKPTVAFDTDDPVYPADDKNWYNGNVDFVVKIKDEVSGIKYVKVKINGEEIYNDINGADLTLDFSTDVEPETYIEFTVSTSQNPCEGQNTIEVVVTSAAGQESVVYAKDVYIDTTAPNVLGYEITVINDDALSKVINFLTFGIFANEKVQITVTADDTDDTEELDTAGVRDITLFLNGVPYGTEAVNEDNQAVFEVTVEALAACDNYSADISAVATDWVNNTTDTPVIPTTDNSNIKDNPTLMIETVLPGALINPKTDPVTEDGKDWYADDVKFEVEAADANSGIREVLITINGFVVANETFTDADDIDIYTDHKVYEIATNDKILDPENNYILNDDGSYKLVGREKDGSYTVVATVTDNAGNVVTEEHVIYKDVDDPYITNFDFQAADYVEGNESIVGENDEDLVITTDYGFYFKADTNVIITAKDVAPTAGIKSITYYTVDFTNDSNGVKSAEITEPVNESNQITIKIPANFKGQIYAKATDNVLNVTDKFANPNSAIVETQHKHDTATYDHIVIDKASTSYTANDGTELYANDVDVTITVEDTYSGIREIEWSVVAPYDTDNNQSGKVTLNNDKSVVEGTETDWTQVETEINLVTKMQKTIKVNNNSNNIIVTVKMTDRAGNTTTEQIEFSIDKVDPNITIVYGNDEVHDDKYTDFFSTKRTATITVTERNFRASDIVFAITNTDRTIPTVDLKKADAWTTTVDSTDPDKTIHVATIRYEADGDYTFDISYKDNAANPSNKVDTHKFTIDMTMPEVTVAYDNNSALNGNYYKADRIATITIKEHNFDSSRVRVIGVATDNGAASTFPATSAWKNNGNDTYTATISYTLDSKYSFDIEFRDKANNSIANYTPEEFYIDKTAPNLSITGVADKSANNGDIAPVVTYSDTNFNKDTVTITLSGINNGADLKYTGSYEDITNGQVYTYDNFEKIQSVDDIYTLTAKITDMAGNETEATISFSANRFGSVYSLTGLEDVISKYLQIEEDIVFTEINVDSLEREAIKIKLTKNGTPYDLVEGTDYTVEVTGGDGEWSVYTYTIKKDLFADDGRYSIAIYSKDAAGNVNENIDEAKAAEISFGIDKTNPVIVPIDLESGIQYAVDMKTASIEIKDNLVLEGVKIYLNGEEVVCTVNGEVYSFDIPKSNSKQDIKIVAIDAAGNEEVVEITEFLVNANIFVRWYNNTPLFVGSIIGVVVIALGVIGFVVFGKKKKEEK